MLVNNAQEVSARANVQLITRVRPLNANDHVLPTPYLQVDPMRGAMVLGGNTLFQLDCVLPLDCPQNVVYKSYIEPTINACLEGYNISIIAYGQSGTGKTYTIFGPGVLYIMNESDFGMVPRAVRHIFCKAKEYPDRRFSMQASYLEIYGEEIRDLLSMEPFHGEITVQEGVNGETVVAGATRMECQTLNDVFSCLETGLALRHAGPMMPSQLSNRSHGIFTLYIQQAWTKDGCVYEVQSQLQFIDLAGSERLSEPNDEMARHLNGFQDSVPINSGLLALSNVTAALGEPRRKANHVPYWDSKLTSILKDSLGGNAFTLMIVCLSPSASDLEETLNSLKFATTAANIVNRPVANIRVTPLANVPLSPMPIQYHTFAPIHAHPSPLAQPAFSGAQSSAGTEETQTDSRDEGSLEDELFRLRFAASQWQLLVTNAEVLLSELATMGTLAEVTQNRIDSWLCLKEEYANCIDPDLCVVKPRLKSQTTVNQPTNGPGTSSAALFSNKEPKMLHVIDEVSEPTPTHELTSDLVTESDSDSDASASSSESNLSERLDALRQQFREATDLLIDSIQTAYDTVIAQEWNKAGKVDLPPPVRSSCDNLTVGPVLVDKSPSALIARRRDSLFNPSDLVDRDALKLIAEARESPSESASLSTRSSGVRFKDALDEDSRAKADSEPDDEIRQEMRRLSETSESRRAQVLQTNKQLKRAQDTLAELRQAIELKEEFIKDLTQADRESALSKQRFEEKIERLEQDAAQTRLDLSAAQNRLRDLEESTRRKASDNNTSDSDGEEENHRERISRHHREIARYESRLRDVVKLLELTGRSPRKVEELERSLSIMKEQQSILKEQLRQENERKRELKQELENDHKRIVELEHQLREKRRTRRKSTEKAEQPPSLGEKDCGSGESEMEHRWRWLVAEEERLVELRAAIQSQSDELEERQNVLEKREMAIDRSHQSEADEPQRSASRQGTRRKKEPPVDDKMVQTAPLNFTADERCPPAGGCVVDKETIRKEIRNMRHTRDTLVQQRQELDERNHRGRELDPIEERRMIEIDEAIEAVDAAMEYKNEILCSRHYEADGDADDALLSRLMSLTHAETRSLLCKYFNKVIDLRDGSKKMEQQFAELEAQFEDQSRYVRKLCAALKHTQLEVERRAKTHQRHYEHKISSALKHIGDEFDVGDPNIAGERKLRNVDVETEYRDGRDLRRHLRELLSITPRHRPCDPKEHYSLTTASAGGASADPPPSVGSSRAPSLRGLHAVQALHEKITGLQRMKGRQAGPATTTTVTREKNKLIIKQQPLQQEMTKESKRRQR